MIRPTAISLKKINLTENYSLKGLLKLKEYNPEAIIMDLIFAYPSDSLSDFFLVKRLKEFDNAFLPVSFSLGVDSISAIRDYDEFTTFKLKKFLGWPKLHNGGKTL